MMFLVKLEQFSSFLFLRCVVFLCSMVHFDLTLFFCCTFQFTIYAATSGHRSSEAVAEFLKGYITAMFQGMDMCLTGKVSTSGNISW